MLGQIENVARNPAVLKRAIRRLGLRINGSFYSNFVFSDRVSVMDEDWDNLIILDGCRYDTFSELNHIDGIAQYRLSKGSSSGEFLRQNFLGGTHHDTVYLTANPYLDEVGDSFHTVLDLVHDDRYWDKELGTVLPDSVVKRAKEMGAEFPHKRYIVHFIQPHYPFIGDLRSEIEFDYPMVGKSRNLDQNAMPVWNKLPEKSWETTRLVRRAYRENLEIVLKSVEELVDKLGGKSVITADHGNMLGERQFPIPVRGYGHPIHTHVPALIKVPWHVVERGNRRIVESDPPVEWDGPDEDLVAERLRDLGYTA